MTVSTNVVVLTKEEYQAELFKEFRRGEEYGYQQILHPRCHAQRDGDCSWSQCPQAKDRQPSCPLYQEADDE